MSIRAEVWSFLSVVLAFCTKCVFMHLERNELGDPVLVSFYAKQWTYRMMKLV